MAARVPLGNGQADFSGSGSETLGRGGDDQSRENHRNIWKQIWKKIPLK